MSTSPASSSQAYLIRARQQSGWDNNRRGRHAGFSLGPVLPVLPSVSECGEASASEATNLWSTGSVLCEAKEFSKMVGRWTIEELRADISISPAEMRELEQWCEVEPEMAWHVRKMIRYRASVLREFDRLVQSRDASPERKRVDEGGIA